MMTAQQWRIGVAAAMLASIAVAEVGRTQNIVDWKKAWAHQ
jgi:hypothetical protein